MYRLPLALQEILQAGQIPIVYIVITTDFGQAFYSDVTLPPSFSTTGSQLSVAAGISLSVAAGIILASSQFVVSEVRVVDFGSLVNTLIMDKTSRLNSSEKKAKAELVFVMDNTDKELSRKVAKEPFLGKTVQVKVAAETLPVGQHFTLFEGIIEEITLSDTELEVRTIEE